MSKKKGIVPKKDTEIAEVKQPISMEEIILQAVEKGIPVETFEKILALKERVDASEAKKQFDLAMANAQAEFPEIKKTKKAMDGNKFLYAYAPIESIVSQVRGILSKNGLSYSIKTEMGENKVKSICVIKHIAGHSEYSEMEVPLGTKTGIMSNSQVAAAASTFSKRYAFMNALGIMTGDEDREEALQITEGNIETAKSLLQTAMTESELFKIFKSLSKELKGNKEVIAYASEIKKLIIQSKKDEDSQNPTV